VYHIYAGAPPTLLFFRPISLENGPALHITQGCTLAFVAPRHLTSCQKNLPRIWSPSFAEAVRGEEHFGGLRYAGTKVRRIIVGGKTT
jgi:hypothetical protein